MEFLDKILSPYFFVHDIRQRMLKTPTDPKEIHRRADLIRARLKAEKRLGKLQELERVQLEQDLSLIKFDQAIRDD